MSPPLVSILIPCYNAERWIAETLDSAYAQTWPNFEVIVVNDGSTDGSRAILEQYRQRGLQVIDQPNQGQTSALNRCVNEAKGAFIQYLDADDVLAADKIERQMQRLLQQPDCIATGEWARFRHDINTAVFTDYETWRDLSPVDWLVADWCDGGGMMYPALWLIPRVILDAAGPWNEELTLSNDTEYFTRAVLASQQVLFCAGARTYYRSGIAGSLSGLKTRRGWQSQFEVITSCETNLLRHENSDRTKRVCAMLWQRFAHASYPHQRDLANTALRRAALLHSARLEPDGGPVFQALSQVLGWKVARMTQRLFGRS